MLCYVTRPDAVVMEVEVEAKANGEDCLNQVKSRAFLRHPLPFTPERPFGARGGVLRRVAFPSSPPPPRSFPMPRAPPPARREAGPSTAASPLDAAAAGEARRKETCLSPPFSPAVTPG